MNTNTISDQEFTELYNEYRPRLYSFAEKFIFDKTQINDVVHDVFVKVLKYDDYNSLKETHLTAWLFTVTRNACINFLSRKKHKMLNDAVNLDLMVDEDEMIDGSISTPFHNVSTKEMCKLLLNKMKNLPEKYRKVLRLRYYDNLSYDEITAKTKITKGYIGYILNKSISMLKDSINEHENRKPKIKKVNVKKALKAPKKVKKKVKVSKKPADILV